MGRMLFYKIPQPKAPQINFEEESVLIALPENFQQVE